MNYLVIVKVVVALPHQVKCLTSLLRDVRVNNHCDIPMDSDVVYATVWCHNRLVTLILIPNNHVTNSLDPAHKIQEHMDLSHKIQVVGKPGYFTSKT